MESATVRRVPPLPGLIQLGLIALLLVLAAIAWALTGDQMSGMDAGPGTDPGSFGFFLGVWVVMMAAMMFPSFAPMVVMLERMARGRADQGRLEELANTPLFVAGYLVAWAGAGLAGYGTFKLGQALTGDVFGWRNGGRYLAGGIVLAAAMYQLTPLKDVCVRYCRSPLMFLMKYSRAGLLGSLRAGVIHGGWCVGCCWALMAALFALGVMSIGWMAFVAALIAVEKLLPWGRLATYGVATVLAVLGLWVIASPGSVPGLTVPGSHEAMQGDSMMGGG
jgi:predicted metal-binding membrane protein